MRRHLAAKERLVEGTFIEWSGKAGYEARIAEGEPWRVKQLTNLHGFAILLVLSDNTV